jgi:hypothetical protein
MSNQQKNSTSFTTTYTMASVTLVMNSPPKSGRFIISPSSGYALEDIFLFTSYQWIDDDLPLFYQYGILSVSDRDKMIVLRSRLPTALAKLYLPSGSMVNNFTIPCFVRVFDSLDGNNDMQYNVQVWYKGNENNNNNNEVAEIPFEGVEDFVRSNIKNIMFANDSGYVDVDQIKQVIGISSYLLNQVNCSLVSDEYCHRLNRFPCSNTPQTCGKCMNDSLIGIEGDANELCMSVEQARMSVLQYDGSNNMNDDQHVKLEKSCPNNCSNHGICRYKSSMDSIIWPIDNNYICTENDLRCTSYCECMEGYGGSICSITMDELESRQSMRYDMLESLILLNQYENMNIQSIDSMITMISTIAKTSDELSMDGAMLTLELSNTVIDNLKDNDNNVNNDMAVRLLVVIQVALSTEDIVFSNISISDDNNSIDNSSNNKYYQSPVA